jgi:hypothetical protein
MSQSRRESLLAALQRTKVPVAAEAPPPAASVTPVKSSRAGKPVQFWLHEEDRKRIRELAAWLAGQGIRPTDSMVVRAALRLAKTGPELLAAYQQAAALDGRLRRSRPE